MGVGETITVINRSGKVVSSSKHLVNVFKEAKSAYRERKAEIKAERTAALADDKRLRDSFKGLRLDDDTRSRASSHRSKATHRSKSARHPPPLFERGFTDSFYANDEPARRRSHPHERDLAGDGRDAHQRELVRRSTDMHLAHTTNMKRSKSQPDIDMDLAYGELPPPLPSKRYDDGELREKASKLTMLLDEANCLQHSVTTMVENLQKNPDALAAVALTLAEISTMVGKMGPSVLPLLKGSFPAVAALLVSPQFMIAGGVAIGVTIVALGGFKIIKKIQAQKDQARAPEVVPIHTAPASQQEPYQLDELESRELSRIEVWRRGIADVEAGSQGTTVDGEFITPGATRQLVAEGVLDEDDLKSRRSARSRRDKEERKKKDEGGERKSKDEGGERKSRGTKAKSVRSAKSTKSVKSSSERSKSLRGDAAARKRKEPSLVRTLFRAHTTA